MQNIYLLRNGKLEKVSISEDSGLIIAVKTMEVLKKEQSFHADKIVRDEVYTLQFDTDKGKYNFFLTQTPYGADGAKFTEYGTCWCQSKGDAIRDKQGVNGKYSGYDVYSVIDNERVLIPLIEKDGK